ncbi:MAG: bifunctional transcriptional activator/DNA repair protein Ada [Ignavibacteriales bacterium]|nr:bifunctional transcriptional activator/DNA repair protein Ada [Ignavibacteriales bacterium]
MAHLPSRPEMESAYTRRDASYDGIFWLGVRTTGIFCRPSCSARKPHPENVEFFASPKEAVFAGYRPCKRCRPMETNGAPPEWVGKLLREIEQHPTDRFSDPRIRSMGIDPARARRYFLKHYGMTFQAYTRGRRLGLSLEQIRKGADLDDVSLGTGYSSHSGFRDAFVRTFGNPPGKSRTADCVVTCWIESPLGPLVAAATSDGVCMLEFSDRRMLEHQFTRLRRHFKSAIVPGTNPHLTRLQQELQEYFAGTRTQFSVPIIFPGNPFEQKVWKALLTIPPGTTASYQDIARKIGSPKSVRAVGRANGMNRIAILIPCHRVINKDGSLGGYGGGLWRKKRLLELEGSKASLEFFEPWPSARAR